MDSSLANRTALITGGSSGIGLSLALLLASLRVRLLLVARREALLNQAREQILRAQPEAQVRTLALDISHDAMVARALAAEPLAQEVDILVNNAGVVMPGRFLELPTEQFRQMMDINYFGMVHVCKAVVPHMVSRRRGHVLNVSSLAGVLGIYGYTAYSASKFAVVGFSQALRAELWPHGIQVSVCLPPDTDTPQLAVENQLKPPETHAIAGKVTMLHPDVVARAMVAGMAAGRFEIYPNLGSRLVGLGQAMLPGVTRWVCDSAQKKASRG